MPDRPVRWRPRQVAATLGVSAITVRRMVKAGQLQAIDAGTKSRAHYRIHPADVITLILSRATMPQEGPDAPHDQE